MANSKIIIVEGAQGAGKTTITDFIRNNIPHTNLYRLNGTSDSTACGKAKAQTMYINLLNYMKTLENASINLLFDRTFFSEEVYCRLGFKEYSFTDVYEELLETLNQMDFDIYYITLYLHDENEYEKRLQRADKADNTKYSHFNKDNSINQQRTYLELADEVAAKCPRIHVIKLDNMEALEKTEAFLKELLLQKLWVK